MNGRERFREPVRDRPTPDYLNERRTEGWNLVALEWEREAKDESQRSWVEEIPYGLQVSPDCSRLVQNPKEMEIVTIALDMIVEDCPLSHVSDELNRRGLRTRQDARWTPGALFNLLPRMIQMGPRLFASDEWTTRRQRLPKVV
jgi:hypothetical protein